MEDLECLFTYLIEYLEFNPKSITLKPFADYPTSDQDSSQNIDQTKKRYSSTIIKKKYDCIIISKNGEELQNDFSMSRNLQCFDRKIMKDSRCKEGASVEFEVKLLTEDKYMALNLIFL